MKMIPENIRDFLSKNRVATVCFINELNRPYCFNGLFVISGTHPVLVFKSSYGSSHEDATRFETEVSGTVLPERLDLLKIKGVQFVGKTLEEKDIDQKSASEYYNKYPFGRVVPGYIWAIRLERIKFTDSSLAFAQKTVWAADANK